MQQNIESERSEVGVVFWVSAAVALVFILWGVIAPASFGAVTQGIFDWVVSNLGWFYLLAGNFFQIFAVILALSRYGRGSGSAGASSREKTWPTSARTSGPPPRTSSSTCSST